MSVMPRVSVVLPFLDAERFLEEAIRSVLGQTCTDWELWLVDDGSTDASSTIALSFTARDPRVHYLEHEGHANLGISASRNLGIRHARGEFLALLDADDIWLPEKLERQLALLDDHPQVAMVYCRSLYWHSWTDAPQDRHRDRVQDHWISGDVILQPPRSLVLHLTGRAAIPCPCSVVARTSIVRAVGGFEDSFRGMYEDQVFYAKLCLHHSVFVAEACLDRYRQHPESICSVTERSGQVMSARRQYLDWLVDHLVREGVQDRRLWIAVREELWLARDRTKTLPRVRGYVRLVEKWLLHAEATLLPDWLSRAIWQRRLPALATLPSVRP